MRTAALGLAFVLITTSHAQDWHGLDGAGPAIPPPSEDWRQVELVAQSIGRLEGLVREFAGSVDLQLSERAPWPAGGREQILADTVCGLERAVAGLRRRFFEAALADEIDDRVRLITVLTARVSNAAARLSLYASSRQIFARFQNELDYLRRQIGT